MTLRALFVALLLTFFTGIWVRQAEIVVLATQVTESVPPIPALTAILLLLPVNALLRRINSSNAWLRPFASAELMLIFLFVGVASMVMGIGVVQFLLCLIGTPFYKQPQQYGPMQKYFPAWLFPRDTEIIRQMYERAPDGVVPWHLWIGPGIAWAFFFVALASCLYCVMALFFRAWAEEERLPFPVVSLPLEMAAEASFAPGGFWRDPMMWIGFGIAAIYNGVNIVYAFYPTFPSFGKEYSFDPFLEAMGMPWMTARSVSLHFRPEQIGFGYLVATEVSLTIWLGYFILKALTILAASYSFQPKNLYPMEQGMGAYLALAVVLVYQARRRLARADVRLVLGAGAGFLAVCGFATAAGMAAWVAAAYFALVIAVALVYGRVRAQTGVPMVWLFPYHMQNQSLIYTFGSAPFAAAGPTTIATWTLFAVVAKGYFPTISGFQIEGMEISRREKFPMRSVFWAVTLAIIVGFALGWYHHLTPYYRYGALQLRGDIWGYWAADAEANSALAYLSGPVNPEPARIAASGAGIGVVFALSALVTRFVSFPLNPLGYAMTCCFGDVLWFSFLLVWMIKTLVLRYGGMNLYRQSVPLFLGLALGHYAVAGIFWGLVGAVSGEAVRGYEIFFG